MAAFGSALATRTAAATDADPNTPGIQLPTELGGTTIEVNGRRAGLLFVSPNQVNFVIPAATEIGAATVVVRSADGTISQGTAQVNAAAPAIFTANSSGQGVPAGSLLRVLPNGTQVPEPLAQFNPATGAFTTRPINLGAEGERVFLILYLSGIRGAVDTNGDGNVNETVHLLLGGHELVPAYAGPQGTFVGLDQLNAEIPRSMIGRGPVNLAVNFTPRATSNLTRIEIAGNSPVSVDSFSPATALAGQELVINGAGFAAASADNQVFIVDQQEQAFRAKVIAATPNQLKVIVPFGAGSGPVLVHTPQGEAASASALIVRTSTSGFVEDTSRQPMPGVTVRLRDTNLTATTSREGSFILPDVPATAASIVEVDGTTALDAQPYPKLLLRISAQAGRDNQFPGPISLAPIIGPSLLVGSASADLASEAESAQAGGVTFEVPSGASAVFPDGATSGALSLTVVENSRLPAALPPGIFSSTIAQITPFGVTLAPGGKLTFPNTDGLPAGAQAKLFRLDQTPNSPTFGSFIEAGTATVSTDGQRIETAAGAVTETSCYFVALPRAVTTVIGRVVESDGVTPVRQVCVRVRGQEAFTDGNGNFVLPQVAVKDGESISVEASFLRPTGRVDRAQRSNVPAIAGGITSVTPDIVLPSETSNRPPILLTPAGLRINQGETHNISFIAMDPDADQTLQVAVTGAAFASVMAGSNNAYALRLAPGSSDGGTYTLTLSATDSAGASTTQSIALKVNRAPVANAQTITTTESVARSITLTGSDPDGDQLSFIIASQPAHGALAGTAPNLTYIPALSYAGADSFTFKVSDGLLESSAATVSITVNAINDARRFAALSGGVSVLMPGAMAANATTVASLSAGVSVLMPGTTTSAITNAAPLSNGVSVLMPGATTSGTINVAPLSGGVSVLMPGATATATANIAPLSAGVSVQFSSATVSSATNVAPLSNGVSVQFALPAGASFTVAPLSPGVSVQAAPAGAAALPATQKRPAAARGIARGKPPPQVKLD